MIKYHFPPSICFVKDIKLIQHDWIIKHILDNILSHDTSNLNIIIKDIFSGDSDIMEIFCFSNIH